MCIYSYLLISTESAGDSLPLNLFISRLCKGFRKVIRDIICGCMHVSCVFMCVLLPTQIRGLPLPSSLTSAAFLTVSAVGYVRVALGRQCRRSSANRIPPAPCTNVAEHVQYRVVYMVLYSVHARRPGVQRVTRYYSV